LRNASDVAALRISAHGHEGFILQGALEYLREVHKPDVVYVEFWPAAMRAAGYASPVTLVQSLYDLGYSDIAHAGRVCDVRWQNATQGLHLQVCGVYAGAGWGCNFVGWSGRCWVVSAHRGYIDSMHASGSGESRPTRPVSSGPLIVQMATAGLCLYTSTLLLTC
jgi:hypothetical protein